eukprot:scaffold321361_cov26-Tisochrysis_lutea.AAC.1
MCESATRAIASASVAASPLRASALRATASHVWLHHPCVHQPRVAAGTRLTTHCRNRADSGIELYMPGPYPTVLQPGYRAEGLANPDLPGPYTAASS